MIPLKTHFEDPYIQELCIYFGGFKINRDSTEGEKLDARIERLRPLIQQRLRMEKVFGFPGFPHGIEGVNG